LNLAEIATKAKIEQNHIIQKILLQTGSSKILFDNKDNYFGVHGNIGENWLGKIYMEQRKILISEENNRYIQSLNNFTQGKIDALPELDMNI